MVQSQLILLLKELTTTRGLNNNCERRTRLAAFISRTSIDGELVPFRRERVRKKESREVILILIQFWGPIRFHIL